MKTYWEVTCRFYEDGKITTEINTIQAEEMPPCSQEDKGDFDEYKDYFLSEGGARSFARVTRKEGTK